MKNTIYLMLFVTLSQFCLVQAQDQDLVAKGILDKLSNTTEIPSKSKKSLAAGRHSIILEVKACLER